MTLCAEFSILAIGITIWVRTAGYTPSSWSSCPVRP